MKKRIFLYFMILTVIGISITGFFISQLAQKYYKYEAQESLANTVRLIQYQIDNDLSKGIYMDFNQYSVNYADLLNKELSNENNKIIKKTRITFIDMSGKVVGESDTDYKDMENHISRKEVQEAMEGKLGVDMRYSKTLNSQFLYAALLIKSANVVARVSIPLVQLNYIDKLIWYYTLAGIIAGLVLTSLLALKFSSYVTHPIDERIKSINTELENTIAELTDKNVKVDAIINSMVIGIVAVDNKYKVMMINSKACEFFGIKSGPGVIGINIIELIRNRTINSFLTETIHNNTSHTGEISIGSPHDRVLRVHSSPIKSKDSVSLNSGGILFIEDISTVKKLEQIRTEFVSNVTHELKTPLTSIRGFIETLKGGAMEDMNVAKKFLDIIDIEAERLYMLINDILQLSEIESKQKDSNISEHNLKSIVDEVIPILQSVAEKKNVSLHWEIGDNIKIMTNKDKLKQMLINLIDNGIKYNVDGGSVFIKAYKYEGKIVISIKDTGIGIPDAHISRIFERFYRVDKGRSRNMGGTGLGLSIVKHIVNLYNGEIKVSSEPGKGTEFIIRLPA